ncbi:sodium:proton antiporter [Mumia sp. zg.B53]|uniref:DUF6328 family protein n=1 Tax=unclassified Mumia TaxID=2621872 RepID=UPI001C6F3FD7|nr:MULTISPECIES: DUF6328 family protein [unclassified Mumia]MBW9207074.1 sodium:proton antiporter [Mumia sp. zg.B17]MBW9210590.1 sodium:proton antiporter [Mumia sp. zg.B21]MBW9215203.1 sodium:proton antiporter [Mumia sp. zg.B53]MDD9348252.1 DUF6328 family protein [Mumia sp.]
MPEERRVQGETLDERLTRNWSELLQELRVVQTGVQIITAFLLTVVFTNRFAELSHGQELVYLAVLSGSVLATALLVAPVAIHRALFRKGQRLWLVSAAHVCASLGLTAFAFTVSGVMWLVFDVVVGPVWAWWAFGASTVVFGSLWVGLPLINRRTR